MSLQLAPAPVFQGIGFAGLPLPGGKLFTYVAGTSTPQATYTDPSGAQQNTNPVILNANGQADVWLFVGQTYKLVLQDQFGNQVWSKDNIPGGINVNPIPPLTQAIIGSILYPPLAAEGTSVINSWFPYGYVDRYATNSIPGTTDMSGAFSTAAQLASLLGCSVNWGATAPYRLNSPVNCTAIRGVVFNDNSSANYSNNIPSVIIAHTGHGFDLAASTELTFNNVVASNLGGIVPKTVFFAARNSSGAGGGLNRFNNCRTAFNSKFSWIFYGYGSEENTFYACEMSNNQPGGGLFSHNQTNPAGYISTFLIIATGSQSNTENHHYAFGYFNFGNSGSQNEIIWQLENTGNFTARDGTWANANGLAYTNVIGNTASTNLTFDSIRGEPLGTKPLYGVYVSNTAGVNVQWTFNNVTADAVNELLSFNPAVTPSIQNLAMRASTCTSGKSLAVYSMSNSIIETAGGNIITGAAGGSVTNNTFIGWKANITLSGTANTNIFIDNNTGLVINTAVLTGWGTPTGTGAVANFSGSAATNAQMQQAIATIISTLKTAGLYGA